MIARNNPQITQMNADKKQICCKATEDTESTEWTEQADRPVFLCVLCALCGITNLRSSA